MRATKFISIMLHPAFMPLIVLYVSLKLTPTIGFAITSYLPFIYAVIILGTIVLPLTSAFILLKTGQITSIELCRQEERPAPLLISSIWFACTYYILLDILLFAPVLKAIIIGAVITVFCSSFISVFWKISLHMLGVGGVIGVLISLNFLFGELSSEIIIGLFLCGILGVSRNIEKAHNQEQIYAGFILGCVIECVSILFY